MKRIGRIARARVVDPYEQRHNYWMHYVEKDSAAH